MTVFSTEEQNTERERIQSTNSQFSYNLKIYLATILPVSVDFGCVYMRQEKTFKRMLHACFKIFVFFYIK